MEAAKIVMQWSVDERGVERFIAETEKGNKRSARLLEKLGFVLSDTIGMKLVRLNGSVLSYLGRLADRRRSLIRCFP